MSKLTTTRIDTSEKRQEALRVVRDVYYNEKKWISDPEQEIGTEICKDDVKYSWFMVKVNDEPAGLLRLHYDPPLEFPAEFKVSLRKDIDLKAIAENGRFVDIGRFMILPRYRRKILVALRLMRAAIKEVVERNYTHFITDVFEGDPHSPFHFHTKVLGFEVIGTHLHGELNCSCTRIILTLDILKAYKRIKQRRNKIYRLLTADVRGILDKKLGTHPAR